jgi:hypothetical protein
VFEIFLNEIRDDVESESVLVLLANDVEIDFPKSIIWIPPICILHLSLEEENGFLSLSPKLNNDLKQTFQL